MARSNLSLFCPVDHANLEKYLIDIPLTPIRFVGILFLQSRSSRCVSNLDNRMKQELSAPSWSRCCLLLLACVFCYPLTSSPLLSQQGLQSGAKTIRPFPASFQDSLQSRLNSGTLQGFCSMNGCLPT